MQYLHLTHQTHVLKSSVLVLLRAIWDISCKLHVVHKFIQTYYENEDIWKP